MRLPSTAAPYLFLMGAGQRFVNFNSSLSVTSVSERINGGAIVSTTTAAQPTWTSTAPAGQFRSTNVPGSQNISGLTFAGTQNLEYDALVSSASSQFDGYADFTLTSLVSCTAPAGSTAQTVWAFGNSTGANPTLALQYKSGNLQLQEINGNGTFTASAATDTGVHVVTCSRVGITLTLRVDGVQVATATVTPAGAQYDKFCIGAMNTNGAVTLGLTGSVGAVMAWKGAADVQSVEAFLMLETGIIRTSILS